MANPSPNPINSRADFRRRLGYYLTGLAIGCFMAGMIYYARKADWERQQREEQSQSQEVPESPGGAK